MTSVELDGFTLPVIAPAYVDEGIADLVEEMGIEFRHRITEDGMTSMRVKGGIYRGAMRRSALKVIEIPVETANGYVVNCAILHEVARIIYAKKKIRSEYALETKMWDKAEKLRKRSGFSEVDPDSDETWDGIRIAILQAIREDSTWHERVWVSLCNVLQMSFVILGCVFGAILTLMLISFTPGKYGYAEVLGVLETAKPVLIAAAVILIGCAVVAELQSTAELIGE